ncbi:MAG: hypothetical protein V9G19_27855 [Tetrasphaera sp.]
MNPIAMTVLVATALALFGYSASRRIRLLLTGAPANARLEHLFDRMAGAPDHRTATLPGLAILYGAAVSAVLAPALALAGLGDSDVSQYFLGAAGIVAAQAGGHLLFWALSLR